MTDLRLLPHRLIVFTAFLAASPVGAQDVQIFPENLPTVLHRAAPPHASESFVPVDSVYYDDGDSSLGFTISIGGAEDLNLAVRFDAASDFELTHVRFWGRKDGDAVSGDVTVDVYDGAGFTPNGSTLLYSQAYPDLLTQSGRFRYVGLDTPLSFAAGEAFFVVVRAEASPAPGGPLGADFGPGTGDYAGRSFFGASGDGWNQLGDVDEDGFDDVFLIRAVTDNGEPPTVCDGDITLSTQAEVDAFDCTGVGGNLSIDDGISSDDITDLSPLAGLETVGGNLDISGNDLLTSLAGLENLASVGGDLRVSLNGGLPSLAGLESLAIVGDDLTLFVNSALTSLAGLENLTSIGDNLGIVENGALSSLDGLGGLTAVGGSVDISGNGALTSITGLGKLTTVGGSFGLSGNAELESLEGLSSLTSVGGLGIVDHPGLTTLTALENLTTVGPMTIRGNDALESLAGLEGLTVIGGALVIGLNASLISLEALSNVTAVDNALAIGFNPSLESLDGLEGVISVGDDLLIIENATLSDCACGLAGVISGEPPMFSGVGGEIMIENNATDGVCASPESVLDAFAMCMPVSNEPSAASPHRFALSAPYPNPFIRSTTITIGVPSATNVRLAVYDVLGREVAMLIDGPLDAGWHEVAFDAPGLPSGPYFVQMTAEHESRNVRRVTLLR